MFGTDAVFTGQVKDGKPNGFIRAFNNDGDLFEGFMDSDCLINGFGRDISYENNHYIGWYHCDLRNGNGQQIKENGRIEEGWFENHNKRGGYRH